MLVRAGPNHAVLAFARSADEPGLKLLDRRGNAQWVDIGGRKGRVEPTPDGRVAIRHESGVALLDPAQNFAVTELVLASGTEEQPWDLSFLEILVDTRSGRFFPYALDRDSLDLPDPGYSEPTDAVLLPGGRNVAVHIVRCQHLALFNLQSRMTRLVTLSGSYGSSHGVVVGGDLWLKNYDTLCRVDLETLEVFASSVLQPAFRDPQHGLMTSGFIGVPRACPALGGWLVPRPYSGDILLVRADTLTPTASIACGGRPYDLVEFSDGDLLVLDHPFDTVRTASLGDLTPL